MNIEAQLKNDAEETAKLLRINKKQALALVFIAKSALCEMVKHQKGKTLFTIAANHAIGKINSKDKQKLMKTWDEIQ